MDKNGNIIADDFQHGENFKIGGFCLIEPDVIVGDDVKLGHYVHLASGTRIGNNVDFARRCYTTGLCYIGNGVNVRAGSCVSKGLVIEDHAFIGAGIMSSHTRRPSHGIRRIEPEQYISRIGYGAIVGSRVNLTAGVIVGPGCIIGYGANVIEDCTEPGVYIGNPAKRSFDVADDMKIEVPGDYRQHCFDRDMVEEYLPHYKLPAMCDMDGSLGIVCQECGKPLDLENTACPVAVICDECHHKLVKRHRGMD